MALEGHLEATEILADGLCVREDGFAFGLVGNGPMLGVGHGLLEIVAHITDRKESFMDDNTAVHRVGCAAHKISRCSFGRIFFLHAFECFSSQDRIGLCTFAGIEEAFAVPAMELDAIAAFFGGFGDDDDVGNHLLHAPCTAVAKHSDVADDLVGGIGVWKFFFEFDIDRVEECRHLFAFVALLAGFGGDDRFFESDRLLDEGNSSESGILCETVLRTMRNEIFGQEDFFLVADIGNDDAHVAGEVRLEGEITVIVGGGSPFGRDLGIDGRVGDGVSFLIQHSSCVCSGMESSETEQ